jgi:Zinc-binding dehydrogenase
VGSVLAQPPPSKTTSVGVASRITRPGRELRKPNMTTTVGTDHLIEEHLVKGRATTRSEPIIAMSRHEPRQQLAREYGATDIITERGDDGVAKIKELTNGLGAHSVIEAVGTQESPDPLNITVHSDRTAGATRNGAEHGPMPSH